jgi:hypothetical protein
MPCFTQSHNIANMKTAIFYQRRMLRLSGAYIALALVLGSLAAPLAPCMGQARFQPGYVLLNPTDTLRGLLSFSSAERLQDVVLYKARAETNIREYKAGEVYGFEYDDNQGLYLSKTVPLEGRNQFFKVLVDGKLRLLMWDKRFFMENAEHGLRELRQEIREVEIGGNRAKAVVSPYIGMLKAFTNDCPGMDIRPEQVKLLQQPLVDFVQQYHACVGAEQRAPRAELAWRGVQLGVGVGARVMRNTLKSNYSFWNYLKELEYQSFVEPTIGLSLHVMSPRISQRLAFTAGAWYIPLKIKGQGVVQGTFDNTTYRLSYVHHCLEVPLNIRIYTRPGAAALQPFVEGGLSPMFVLIEHEREANSTRKEIISELSTPRLQLLFPAITASAGLQKQDSGKRRLFAALKVFYQPGLIFDTNTTTNGSSAGLSFTGGTFF